MKNIIILMAILTVFLNIDSFAGKTIIANNTNYKQLFLR